MDKFYKIISAFLYISSIVYIVMCLISLILIIWGMPFDIARGFFSSAAMGYLLHYYIDHEYVVNENRKV